MVARDDLIFTESKIFFMLTAFFYCFKVIGDLEKQIEGMKRTVERKGTELQLFSVIVGEDLKNIPPATLFWMIGLLEWIKSN